MTVVTDRADRFHFCRKSLEPEQFYSRETDRQTAEHADSTSLETACCVSILCIDQKLKNKEKIRKEKR